MIYQKYAKMNEIYEKNYFSIWYLVFDFGHL